MLVRRVVIAGCSWIVLVAASGCQKPGKLPMIWWESVKPIAADQPIPETLPELLDYSRLPELAVHHPDTRQPVEPDEFPYTSIGQLLIYYPDGTVGQSTAFLIAPAHILTVADGFVGPDGEREFTHAVFTPGLSGGSKPFGSAQVVKAAVPRLYIKEVDMRARNLAVALLDRNIGEDAGYLAFESIDPHENTGVGVSTAGYARDTGAGTMVRAQGRFERYGYPGLWWHDLDGAIGQNGSPIWIHRDDQPVVIGMLINGEGRHSQAIGPSHDDKEILNAIERWIRLHPYRP